MNKRGFTLIELLAVITIMGILMLVAIPAVSRILENVRNDEAINNTKVFINEANKELISLSSYSSGVSDGKYKVMSDGNICLESDIENADECNTYKIFEVPLESGQNVSGGEVEIANNKIIMFYNIKYINRYVNMKNVNDYVVSMSPKEFVQSLCKSISGSVSYDLGSAYNCKVKDDVINKFYILKVSGDTVSLIMDKNIVDVVAWHKQQNGINFMNYNACGPTNAYNELYNATKDWTNVPSLSINYVDPNISDIKFTTSDSIVTISSRDPDCDGYEVNFNNLKARLPYNSELNSSYTWLYDNLDASRDYWVNETVPGTYYAASTIRGGSEVLGQSHVGVRPVIEVSKSDLS